MNSGEYECLLEFSGHKSSSNLNFVAELRNKIIQNWVYKILGAFVNLRKATISFVTAVSPSVRQHGTTLLSLDRFSLNLTFDLFPKSVKKYKVSFKSNKNNGHFKRIRWSRGKRAGLWYPSSRVQTRRIFSDEKTLSAPSFGGEVKPSVSCRKFTACKRTQKWRESRHFRQNSRQFLADSSTFRCWGSLTSFQTWGTPGGWSWNVLITVPPGGGFDVSLATALCKNPHGLQCRLKREKGHFTWRPIYIFLCTAPNSS